MDGLICPSAVMCIFLKFKDSTSGQITLNQPDAVQAPQQQPKMTMNILPDSQLFTTSDAMLVQQQSFCELLGISPPMINQVKYF